MLQILIDVLAAIVAAGVAIFMLLLVANIVLFFKLRSMFNYNVPDNR